MTSENNQEKESKKGTPCPVGDPHLPTEASVYEDLWRRRDFELSHFWQRAVLLGTFMALSYTGYGAFWIALLKKEVEVTDGNWPGLNLVAMALASLIVIVSVLWVLMMKGSKMWYEIQEASICAFSELISEKGKVAKPLCEFLGFKNTYNWRTRAEFRTISDVCDSIMNPVAGPYSVAKVTIVLGQTSLVIGVFLMLGHLVALLLGRMETYALVKGYGEFVALALAFCVFMTAFWLFPRKTGSSSLSNYPGPETDDKDSE